MWIDQERYIPLKVEFYDRKDSRLKTLTMADYQQFLDQYWRAGDMYMENHQTGKTTLLSWSEFKFRTGLSDSDFNKNTLKRVR